MEKKEITQKVIEILKNNNFGLKMTAHVDVNDSLFEKGIIDSFGIFALVAAVKKQFDLGIEDREIHPGNLETIANLSAFIEKKIKENS